MRNKSLIVGLQKVLSKPMFGEFVGTELINSDKITVSKMAVNMAPETKSIIISDYNDVIIENKVSNPMFWG